MIDQEMPNGIKEFLRKRALQSLKKHNYQALEGVFSELLNQITFDVSIKPGSLVVIATFSSDLPFELEKDEL